MLCCTLTEQTIGLGHVSAQALVARTLGDDADRAAHSAILKDEDRCIRCALCVMRCPADAIAMVRTAYTTEWSCQ